MKKAKIFELRLLPYDLSHNGANLSNLVFRMKKRDLEGKPYKERLRGGAILAMNHTSFLDPVIVSICFWYRRVFFLAGEAVMRGKLKSLLLKESGCIKIDRNISDLEAIKKCVSILKQGRPLCMFPQGSLRQQEEAVEVKSGAVLMALQAGVPIIPMYSPKREHWWKRKLVVIGKPMDCRDYVTKKIPSMGDIETASAALQEAMEACREASERMMQA